MEHVRSNCLLFIPNFKENQIEYNDKDYRSFELEVLK